jgi:DNA adenine methylase
MLPPHNAWVEAFCGSASITLAKKAAPIEVINDLDQEIVNFFQQLRNNGKELCGAAALTPYAYQEYKATHTSGVGLSNLERARRFLVQSMMTINGTFGTDKGGFSYSQSYARSGIEARVSRWRNLPARLEAIVERLRCIRIENRDARDLLRLFRYRPATLIYMDPPYLADRRYGYKHDAREPEFHKELLKLACKSKCMFLISGYENELYNSMLSRRRGWSTIRINTKTRSHTGTDLSRTEVLWQNKAFLKAKQNGSVPIRLSEMEIKENKVNPERLTSQSRRSL